MREKSDLGESVDAAEAIESARAEVKAEKEAAAKRRSFIQATARFVEVSVDPFNIFDLPPVEKSSGCSLGQHLSWKQKELLREKLKVNPDICLALLDVMLPGEDGLSILKKLRAQSQTSDIPIIIASAKGTEYDKVVGLDSGADDYLSKPFGMMELISRVKAVLRRSAPKKAEDILQIRNLVLNRDTHTITADGNKVVLTLKEYELLSTFMSNIGYVFTREQLLQTVWGADFAGETRTVDVHIGTLRTKLGSCGDYIHTIRGVGYRMEEER